jgi:DNA-binding response OmpR family regulator/DNA-binding CsgD family transcriptional regulator
MTNNPLSAPQSALILIVDDVLDNLAVLHDALDESGYTVLVAGNGVTAIQIAKDAQPDLILLDAIMPEMDGFEVCSKLKADVNTSHIPVIFMTGLTEVEHVAAAFSAGGIDYVVKPIRPKEVLARIVAHMNTAKIVTQARSALDAFGQAVFAITPGNGKIVWQTPLAKALMSTYFDQKDYVDGKATPQSVLRWLDHTNDAELVSFKVIKDNRRLIFSLADHSNDEQWVILLREESDAVQIEMLMTTFHLTKRESEVLYWAIKGKTNRDIGDILGSSYRTVDKHLQHVFEKLGVETRTAAASLAASKLRAFR